MNSVGKNIKRVDAYDKVNGKAIYPQDIYFEDMLYGETLRSNKPHAYIELDISEAKKIEGVIKIFTAKDVPYNHHGVVFKDNEVFCDKKVRRIGDPIAFVVATNKEIAKKALKAINVEYKEIEAVFDPIKAMKENSPKVHGNDTNIVHHFKLRNGDVEKSFEDCDVIVENEYVVPQVDHAFLQPESGVAKIDEKGKIILYTATQYPHFDVCEIAQALQIDQKQVKIINCAVGGAFGGREDITMQIHLSLAAKILKRPIKTTYSREESFIAHSKRHSMIMKYKTGATKDGKLKALKATIIGDTGAYASWAINVLRKAGVHATGPYEIENVCVDSYAVYTNNPFSGAMRGFGATQVPIAYEQQMDIIANKLNIDPIEFRLKNIFKKGSKTATNQILKESVPLEKCINEVKKNMDFSKKGCGIGIMFYGTGYGNGFPDVSNARAKINQDGKVEIYIGATEVGQGAKTIMSQIGAEVLKINVEDIIFVNEDTEITPDSGTAAASRQTYNSGNAVKIACEKLRDEINKKYDINNCNLKDVYKNIDKELLIKEGSFKAHSTMMDEETGIGEPYWPYTFGACGVEVDVDEETGEIKILNAVVAQDVGKAINPHLIEGQIDGGFAMGVGYTLMEDLNVVNGEIKNNRLSKYIIPTSLDTIDFKKIIVEDEESSAPFGAKGIGEPVMVYVAPAILNAISSASGIRVKKLPATPDNIIKNIKEKMKI
ncbi:molybdopterin-dependent oxidoreductase [Romboutsia sedimentorum]|uniref:Molybdopterin-dependent oxidoreductase n=1 Tax=Romboutsia sedimentorum TaxID=1368474 RepID=A0ABT7EAS1_9FIRM|nr:molybdopterin cofactor-binding domain-containing protein [Romboutsia sedimentorum]MDK2564026.1 molybdopterin-dependent oxidoreductase [Romboutsia sedimentorum]